MFDNFWSFWSTQKFCVYWTGKLNKYNDILNNTSYITSLPYIQTVLFGCPIKIICLIFQFILVSFYSLSHFPVSSKDLLRILTLVVELANDTHTRHAVCEKRATSCRNTYTCCLNLKTADNPNASTTHAVYKCKRAVDYLLRS